MDTAGVKRAASIGLSLVLVACADARKPAPVAPVAATATYGPSPTAAGAASVAVAAPEPPAAPNQCRLDELRGLVGRSRMEIPIPLEPGHRRVLCDTCPRSAEVIAGRQTVLFDARTGLVTSVTCG